MNSSSMAGASTGSLSPRCATRRSNALPPGVCGSVVLPAIIPLRAVRGAAAFLEREGACRASDGLHDDNGLTRDRTGTVRTFTSAAGSMRRDAFAMSRYVLSVTICPTISPVSETPNST